jgi:hypothetical protein
MNDMKHWLGLALVVYGITVLLFPERWLPFQDPRLVANCVIVGLYAIVGVWWIVTGSWPDFFYWLFALGITVTVTFGYAR